MFPKPASSSPQKNPKKRPIDSLEDSDSTIRREFFVIMHYPGNNPGKKYEIKSDKELVKNWNVLKTGATVIVKFGHASLEGTVLYISESLEEAEQVFNGVVKEHQRQFGSAMGSMDQETQTDIDSFAVIHSNATFAAYQMLQMQHEILKAKYDRMTTRLMSTGAFTSDLNDQILSMSPSECDFANTRYRSIRESYDCYEFMTNPLNNIDENYDPTTNMIQIGMAGTKIPMQTYASINWQNYEIATRRLMEVLFPKFVLAFHSIRGTQISLNPTVVSDILECISSKCKISRFYVERAVMAKCIEETMSHNRGFQRRRRISIENEQDENQNPNVPEWNI